MNNKYLKIIKILKFLKMLMKNGNRYLLITSSRTKKYLKCIKGLEVGVSNG